MLVLCVFVLVVYVRCVVCLSVFGCPGFVCVCVGCVREVRVAAEEGRRLLPMQEGERCRGVMCLCQLVRTC